MAVMAAVTVVVYETTTNSPIVKSAREETVRLDITNPVTADLAGATVARLSDEARDQVLEQLNELVKRTP